MKANVMAMRASRVLVHFMVDVDVRLLTGVVNFVVVEEELMLKKTSIVLCGVSAVTRSNHAKQRFKPFQSILPMGRHIGAFFAGRNPVGREHKRFQIVLTDSAFRSRFKAFATRPRRSNLPSSPP